MTDAPISVLVKCRRCQKPLTTTGPMCESCAAWLVHKAGQICSQVVLDAKVETALVSASKDRDVAVADERERCAAIAQRIAVDFHRVDGDRIYQNGVRWAAEQIVAKIREGK
jgi:predicted amidophosphoribosyltransferase